MKGWNGRILRIDLSKGKVTHQEFDAEFAAKFVGGRGFAAKILWDETKPGVPPLSPDNLLIMAAGPLTGLALPSSGKMVIAAKSPLTGGYGDGNLGSLAAVHLRRAGFDAIVVSGVAHSPRYISIVDESVQVEDAKDFWGMGAFETESILKRKHGKTVGVLTIGQGGENLVRYASVVSQEGRSGGRPGMGAVMGSKKLKAVVVEGNKEIPVADGSAIREIGAEGYKNIVSNPNYSFFMRQGTMATVEWSQTASILPAYNFRESVFDKADAIGGESAEKIKVAQKGCPNCNMICGGIIEDHENNRSELDYENVVMLGSNIGLSDLKQIAHLNRMADDYGLDTISLGNTIGFAMEASEKRLVQERLEWGSYEDAVRLIDEIVHGKNLGTLLAKGTKATADEIGHGSEKWAMNVKGLEMSAYNCHSAPGMALGLSTSSIGAHHKESWVVGWEINFDRHSYDSQKAAKVIEHQRIRGGIMECLVTCKFPYADMGLTVPYYVRLFEAATGIKLSIDDINALGDRIYSLIRAFWVREYGPRWNRTLDYPPARWFEEAPQKGPERGVKLDRQGYDRLLNNYYEMRGWDHNGVPLSSTLRQQGLADVAQTIGSMQRIG